MTAFPAATDFNSPEAANRRLANAAFLQTRDLQFYDRLVLEIQRLSIPGENIPLPDPVEMGAWQRAYACYETLRDRAALEESRAVLHNQAFAADQREWNDYVSDREQVLRMLQRGVFDEDTLTEHLDVKLPGDLASPTTAETDRYGSSRHPEWRERATRLASALRWWDALDTQARTAIKQERALKRLQQFKEARSG
jgi:hypothetical protein